MTGKPPAFAPCEITMAFGDDDYLFRLPVRQLAELQEKCKAGIGTIYRRLMTAEYFIEDVHETVRLGLVGGGQDATKARVLMERYFDNRPVDARWQVAAAVISACVVGYEPSNKDVEGEQPGEPKAAMTEDGSTSPQHTEEELSLDTQSVTSTGSPIGN
ncbi:MAG: gene transfer agent family protein [Parvibaculaceae bacterium]|nr:gene transfer agent family protein [Parvibaculaceae bacterium]